jgi:uncharacterized protein with NRDE domain
MCLLVLAWQVHPRYPLIVAANRDEYHERPTAPLAAWDGRSGIVGGRDLRAGGTWLAVNRQRRFGVITNFRDLQRPLPGAPSRGMLIPSYLNQSQGPGAFLATTEPAASTYPGFNLLLADDRELWYATNRSNPFARRLAPGIHGLSNELLDAPWPKLLRVRRQFATWLETGADARPDELFAILNDRTRAASDEELPQTGLELDWERTLSSPFVLDPRYGTRCSTLCLIDTSGTLLIRERRFDPAGEMTGETEHVLNA